MNCGINEKKNLTFFKPEYIVIDSQAGQIQSELHMKKLFYILLTAIVLSLTPTIEAQPEHVDFEATVVVCSCKHNTECDCWERVEDTSEYIYTVISMGDHEKRKRYENLNKHGKVYSNEKGEEFIFTGRYIVLKTDMEFLDPFLIPLDESRVIGSRI